MQEEELSLGAEVNIDREFIEKIMIGMNHITKPFDLFFGKKMKIVVEYNPENQKVKISYFTEKGQKILMR